MIWIRVKPWYPDAKLPAFTREGDCSADLYAYDEAPSVVVWPGKTEIVYTGCAVEIPEGCEGIVRGRSGLSSRGIQVQTGYIDSGYRGRVGVIVHNATRDPFTVKRHDRIAQLAVRLIPEVRFAVVENLSETSRGERGFGSSGV